MIRIGENEIRDIRVGDNLVVEVRKGNIKVWPTNN